VLAIAAGLKDAGRLVGVDHDPQALLATEDNASRNGLEGRIACLLPEAFEQLPAEHRQFDLVLANILAAPLVELAGQLISCLRPGATLVLSGILPEQVEALARAYRRLGEPLDQSLREDWARLVFVRETTKQSE